MTKRSFILYLIIFIFIGSCGDSGSSPTSMLEPVRVNAGVDMSIDENTSIVINGVASGGDELYTYEWTVPSDLTLVHDDPNAASALITAPTRSSDTSYTVSLQVTDSVGTQATDSFNLTVNAVNLAPIPLIVANTIDGYHDLHYPVATEVILDASASFDSDPQTDGATIVSYLWQQVAGLDRILDADTTSSTLRFTTPIVTEAETLEFMLTVSDQEGAQANERVTIELLGQRGTLPHIVVGMPITVYSGELMPLNAKINSNAPDAAPFSALWQHDYSEALIINDSTQHDTYVLAPLVDQRTQVTFTVNAIDMFLNEVSANLEHTVLPPQKAQIPDTGIVLNANDLELQTAYLQDFPGQDAQYGLDRIHISGLADKAGRGEYGFDYTPLNENGDPVDIAGAQSYCIRDNITGLIWELKSNAQSSIHHFERRFTWYQEEENGGFAGELNMQNNTENYVAEVNQQGLCGFFDWRLPSHAELQSIVHYGRSIPPLIDTNYFPFTSTPSADPHLPIWYWTQQTSADGVNNDEARNAWAIDFTSGVDNPLDKTQEHHIRLVRAGRNTE